MIQISPHEARVLGVLVEKEMTTPDQYPLSLNAVTNGANQKNNREPVTQMSEDEVFDALEALRGKGLAVRVDAPGLRVHKYKHSAGEKLGVRRHGLAILAELLLRGPQTLGELRGRASRMAEMESIEETRDMLATLMQREEPLVRELPPSPGTRAERYVQLLSPEAHPTEAAPAAVAPRPAGAGSPLAERVEKLEAEVQSLRSALRRLAEAVGEPDPLADAENQP